jgi:hypothetical protein
VRKGKQSILPWKSGFPHVSRRVEEGTPDPKVGGSNPLRHAIFFPYKATLSST